jgi:hypothetical protein
MANETAPNKWDSGTPHVILPIVHPDEGLTHVAIPVDTDLDSLHKALSDAGYEHPGITTAETGPTEEGTLEESPEFQKATREIFDSMNHGKTKGENAFFMDKNKNAKITGEQFNETAAGGRSMHLDVPADTAYINHVHPDLGTAEPSPKDRETSQNFGVPVYAVSKHGLYMARPSDGQVVKVFDGTDWMGKDFQGDAAFNKNISKDGYTVVVKTGDGKDIAINAGKDYPIDLLKKIRSEGYNGQKVKNAQAFGPGELKEKK